MKNLKSYLNEKFIKSGRWLFTLVIGCGIVITISLFLSDNEVLSIFIPIIFSEIIPRIYSSQRIKEKNKIDVAKSDAEVAAEDAIILIMYLTYISTCLAYYVFTLTSQIQDTHILSFILFWIFMPLATFLLTLLALLKLTDKLSEIIYSKINQK